MAKRRKPRTDNPKGRLVDGRLVYWIKEVGPTAAEQLSDITGKLIVWKGFLSKKVKKELGIMKDGFVLDDNGTLVGLGRSINEAIESLNAHHVVVEMEIFSGNLGEWMMQYPALLDPELKSVTDAIGKEEAQQGVELLGYASVKDLNKDVKRIARELPVWFPSAAKKAGPKSTEYIGKSTELIVVTPDGVDRIPAHYVLLSAERIIASHIPDPFGSGPFSINPLYPENVQERRYEADTHEADKVRRQARNFIPQLIWNTNPDPINGPPMIVTGKQRVD